MGVVVAVAQEPRIRWGPRSRQGMGQFWGFFSGPLKSIAIVKTVRMAIVYIINNIDTYKKCFPLAIYRCSSSDTHSHLSVCKRAI